MRATEILKNEHRVIETVLDCLEVIVARALTEGKLEADAASQALDFLKAFADGCHHAKEEGFLFPMLERKGFQRDGGPTGVMLHEHAIGREEIAAMAQSLEEAALGRPESLRRFAAHARTYIDLLRQHIFKENQVLFPMADRALTSADQETLLAGFGGHEENSVAPGNHAKYLELADALAKRFSHPGFATTKEPLSSCGACHHAAQ